MAAVDHSTWENVATGVAVSFAFAGGLYAYQAYRTGRLSRGWRRLRVQALGGVTTLEQKLNYNCAICQRSLNAREKVRKLSCGHVFHCGGIEKCKESIDKWLCETSMTCPFCRETPRTVWPWEARPPLSAAPASGSSSSASSSSDSLPPPSEQATAGWGSAPPPVSEEEEEPPLEP